MNTSEVIPATEYARRRQQIFDQLPTPSIAILEGAALRYRNGDVSYPFRQDSGFYYLTGFEEPNAILVFLKKGSQNRFILFCEPASEKDLIWTGPRAGLEEAVQDFGADEAYARSEFERHLKKRQKGQGPILKLLDFISEMRLIKSSAEISCMRTAAQISADAHRVLMAHCAPNQNEHELEALFQFRCAQGGARELAYSSIVAGGAHACILHYVKNNKPLQSGDLVLVDAGAEYQNYAADITRTFPVNGKFTAPQKALYELVLKAQCAAIEAIKPGLVWDRLQSIIVEILTEGLVDLGILKGNPKQLIVDKAYQKFYMHSSGHWLGLDVHDAGSYKHTAHKKNPECRSLEAGMVLTVEPGLYICPGHSEVSKEWWGMGIRIEDDILVTPQGYEVLSDAAPKMPEEIEKLMATNANAF